MRILVTGAAGFLGRTVVAHLFRNPKNDVFGCDIYDNRCGGVKEASLVEFADVTFFSEIATIVERENIDVIVHLAAFGRNLTCENWPYRAWEVNVTGTQNVLDLGWAMKARMVVCSSNITLSDKPTVYRSTKWAVEELVRMYARLGANVCGIRPSNIAGPGQSRTEYQPCAFAGMDLSYEKKGYVEVTGDGTQSRDFIHVQDVARAIELALESGFVGETIDICTGYPLSINQVVEYLKIPVRYVDPRPGDAQTLVSNPKPARDILGFQSQLGHGNIICDSFPYFMEHRNEK